MMICVSRDQHRCSSMRSNDVNTGYFLTPAITELKVGLITAAGHSTYKPYQPCPCSEYQPTEVQKGWSKSRSMGG